MRRFIPLITAVLPSAFAAGAQAQSVTIYGVVDAFVEYGKANFSQKRLQSGGANSSRLGFRGAEDLGDGLKAIFQLEHGLLTDAGSAANASAFWNRQAFVGLSGAFGSVTLGRQYTPLLESQDRNDPAINSTGYGSPYNSGVMRTFARADNSVRYLSPPLGGFSATVMVAAGENADFGGNTVYGGNLRYNGGPINVELSHGRQTPGSATQDTKAITNLAATYTVGDIKLMSALQKTRNDSRTQGVLDDRSEFLVGGTWQLGLGRVHAAYGQGKVEDVGDSTAKHYSLAYIYELSKRTAVYTVYQAVENPTNLAYRGATNGFSFDATTGGLPAGAGVKATAFAVGLRHRF
jgi:predicted porin